MNEGGGVPALYDVQLEQAKQSPSSTNFTRPENCIRNRAGWASDDGFYVRVNAPNGVTGNGAVITFLSTETKSHGLSVAEVAYSNENYRMEEFYEAFPKKEANRRYKLMTPNVSLKSVDIDQPLEMFSAVFSSDMPSTHSDIIRCSARLVSTIQTFTFQFRDLLYVRQLWDASLHPKPTDFVSKVNGKLGYGDRVLLGTRCPSLIATSQIDDIDESTFDELLYFLYTGSVKSRLCPELLLQMAEIHEISTLLALGHAQRRFRMDRDKFSKILMLCCN